MARNILPLYTPHYYPTGEESARIHTNRGVICVELFGRETPITVGNFIELTGRGFYHNLKFHAHKPGSVIVSGCPKTRPLGPAQVAAAARGVLRGVHPGTGNARYTISEEWETNARNHHLDGSLVLAHGSDPNSGSSQFYFSLAEQPEFDDKFTVFGQVIEGLSVVHSLVIGDVIESIEVERADEAALASALAQKPPKPQSLS
ncbi:MAG: peptidylprolyl isomerase [Coriobacteriales bacterium]|jgi:peptidyl-prolyl cis-trans isomerase B (cyclophilin B)|nr:peptidylprolyl isomerase [Coriobacteriales bacterium]